MYEYEPTSNSKDFVKKKWSYTFLWCIWNVFIGGVGAEADIDAELSLKKHTILRILGDLWDNSTPIKNIGEGAAASCPCSYVPACG